MVQSNGRFANKVVWISGAAQGIGRGIAEYFSEEGAHVALIDIKRKEGKSLEEEIKSNGGSAKYLFCDIGDEKAIKESIELTVEHFGALHIVINNAAVNLIKPLHKCSSEEWDWQMNINLRAVFLSFKYAYPYLTKQELSYIVNIGSVSSFVGQAHTPGYIASKGGIHMLTKAIAIDYAAEGIRCNIVCPGITDTLLLRTHIGSEELLKERLKRVPTGKILTPKDIAKTVAYLSCEDSPGITGTSIIVDGGYLATAEWKGGTYHE